jgi:hypothetical protein
MIKKALNHELNTVCVNEEQVERMLEVFEKLGMLPPVEKEHWLDRVEAESPQLTSKVDKDGNCVFDQKEVNDVLLWAIKKSKHQ